ncbi:hypothetical protein RQM59_07870 [Flavobacteriaceae bacterium S356]|uniref:Transglycosylase SLT domain-containing protein n=1 Tax=Asprobacillus argus TaxID=3076534 RepID=A0ABU3LFC5_9FLAO|nr:hypothetical protein [Flavobacteriaceae bacterium S356]
MKNLFYCILLLVSANLNSQTTNDSFSEADFKKTKQLIDHFGSVLKKYYPETSTEKVYQKYLSDLLLRKVNPQIIKEETSIDLFASFRQSSTFEKIWSNKLKGKKTIYRINYKGSYFDYLIKNIPNKKVRESFEFFKKEESLDLSPYILVASLQTELTEKDYNTQSVQMAIAMMFYYDIILQYSTN